MGLHPPSGAECNLRSKFLPTPPLGKVTPSEGEMPPAYLRQVLFVSTLSGVRSGYAQSGHAKYPHDLGFGTVQCYSYEPIRKVRLAIGFAWESPKQVSHQCCYYSEETIVLPSLASRQDFALACAHFSSHNTDLILLPLNRTHIGRYPTYPPYAFLALTSPHTIVSPVVVLKPYWHM